MPTADALIDAALLHVPFEGMNDAALRAGARDLGMDPALTRVLVPQGGAGLAAAYHRRGDRALREALAQTPPPPGRFSDRVVAAVAMRLDLADRELVRAGFATLALPQNAALGTRLIWETADAIWDSLGDTSRDVNWYSKRATLSAVFGAAALFWIGDDSPGATATRDFVQRRIDGVMRFEKVKAGLRKVPGLGALTAVTTGWIRAPEPRDLPGGPVRPATAPYPSSEAPSA